MPNTNTQKAANQLDQGTLELGSYPASAVAVSAGTKTPTTNYRIFSPGHHHIVEATIDVTTNASGDSLVLSLCGWDDGAQVWELLIASAAITSATRYNISVNPHLAAVANCSTPRPVRPLMKVVVADAGTDAIAYTVTLHAS